MLYPRTKDQLVDALCSMLGDPSKVSRLKPKATVKPRNLDEFTTEGKVTAVVYTSLEISVEEHILSQELT